MSFTDGLRFGSVCSGIEAASVAWESLGWHAAWLAEIETFPSTVLAHRYPGVSNLGDMTAIAVRILAGEIEAPDVLVGGTPCQAFSVAGLRAGLEDMRGQLTLRYMELANAIDTVRIAAGKRPCVIVWENVPGVLSDKTNAFGCFLAGLAGEDDALQPAGKKWTHAGAVSGPQRTIAWRTLDAQYFGLAQRRRRVFLVASAGDGCDPAEILFECEGVRRDTAPRREPGQGFTYDVAPCLTSGGRGVARTGETRGQDPVVGCPMPGEVICMAHGQGGAEIACDRCPTLTCNHEAPIVASRAARGVNAYGFQPRIGRNGRGDMGDVVSALTSQAGQTGKGDAAPCVAFTCTFDQASYYGMAYAIQAGAQRTNPSSGPDGVGVQSDICYTLEARSEVQAMAFSCKDHGADAAVGIAPTLRAMGHKGSHANAGGQLAVCLTGDVAHTLKAEGFDASEDGTGRGQPIVAFAQISRDEVRHMPYVGALSAQAGMKQTSYLMQDMAVRRITPTECERLQGFPDGWTQVPNKGKPAADGPRYKSLGNSMAVPCMRWLGQRIDAYMKRASKFENGVRKDSRVRKPKGAVSDSHLKPDRNRSLSDAASRKNKPQ